MSEQAKIGVMIFQAPYASLMERGLYLKMHDFENPFSGPVPAEYYLPSFSGEIERPALLPEDPEQRTCAILERVYEIFNTEHPAGYCGRSLSVGDVVKLEGRYYLCGIVGFRQVTFESSPEHPEMNPTACPLALPDGTALKVKVCRAGDYPGVSIDLTAADGSENRVCFVEYNPEREPGHELCVGAYCASEADTVYYDSYRRDQEPTDG